MIRRGPEVALSPGDAALLWPLLSAAVRRERPSDRALLDVVEEVRVLAAVARAHALPCGNPAATDCCRARDEWLDVVEYAKRTGIAPRTIRYRASTGAIEAERTSKGWQLRWTEQGKRERTSQG